MNNRVFIIYNIIGCFLWVFSIVLAGYFLGMQFPWLSGHLDAIVIVIIAITTIPVLIGYLKHSKGKQQNA